MALEPQVGQTRPDRQKGVTALALLSLAAGFLHASVIDSHRGHGIAAGVFAGVALFQIVWAGVAVARANRLGLGEGRTVELDVEDGRLVVRPRGPSYRL